MERVNAPDNPRAFAQAATCSLKRRTVKPLEDPTGVEDGRGVPRRMNSSSCAASEAPVLRADSAPRADIQGVAPPNPGISGTPRQLLGVFVAPLWQERGVLPRPSPRNDDGEPSAPVAKRSARRGTFAALLGKLDPDKPPAASASPLKPVCVCKAFAGNSASSTRASRRWSAVRWSVALCNPRAVCQPVGILAARIS